MKIIVRNKVIAAEVAEGNISTLIQREILRWVASHGSTSIPLEDVAQIADTVAKKVAAEMFTPAE